MADLAKELRPEVQLAQAVRPVLPERPRLPETQKTAPSAEVIKKSAELLLDSDEKMSRIQKDFFWRVLTGDSAKGATDGSIKQLKGLLEAANTLQRVSTDEKAFTGIAKIERGLSELFRLWGEYRPGPSSFNFIKFREAMRHGFDLGQLDGCLKMVREAVKDLKPYLDEWSGRTKPKAPEPSRPYNGPIAV